MTKGTTVLAKLQKTEELIRKSKKSAIKRAKEPPRSKLRVSENIYIPKFSPPNVLIGGSSRSFVWIPDRSIRE
jgi:hypothetical protein